MLLSIVVSVYNEEQALASFYQATSRILSTLAWEYELWTTGAKTGARIS